eukprot:Gregarina_sp_Poly_1__2547@NODE_168_length_12074_cov_98_169901_g149_i0_p6_GENE_NODE_168_length_12074_cov_98_169901_g149_i0NODE_168_length_12074_cov_98_169901_g149_i0_p6_ORF_typecomplete_len224_score3_83Ceratoplatanin/PF07249_12/0_0088Ceratoplatanin/PF07249_12/6e03_NODE_168_length_12074_cov_98_169901_g149_i01136812039
MLAKCVVGTLLTLRGCVGECDTGTDPLHMKLTCTARCHVYSAGDYGACHSYQVTDKDVSRPCGDAAATACISTFNRLWDPNLTNCGNCYLVGMTYDDGHTISTFVKTIDTNESDTKFEMSQVAWQNICPFVCRGTGICAYDPKACEFGVIDNDAQWGYPSSCAVDAAGVSYTRVECADTTTTSPHVSSTASTRPISNANVSFAFNPTTTAGTILILWWWFTKP